MSEVKRIMIRSYDMTNVSRDTGEPRRIVDMAYVLASDYDALAAELKAVEEPEQFARPLSCEIHGLVPNLAMFDNRCPACKRDALAAENERLLHLLGRARTVLGNMAAENKGAIFNRWPISHEPLRADAQHLVPLIDAALAKEPQP